MITFQPNIQKILLQCVMGRKNHRIGAFQYFLYCFPKSIEQMQVLLKSESIDNVILGALFTGLFRIKSNNSQFFDKLFHYSMDFSYFLLALKKTIALSKVRSKTWKLIKSIQLPRSPTKKSDYLTLMRIIALNELKELNISEKKQIISTIYSIYNSRNGILQEFALIVLMLLYFSIPWEYLRNILHTSHPELKNILYHHLYPLLFSDAYEKEQTKSSFHLFYQNRETLVNLEQYSFQSTEIDELIDAFMYDPNSSHREFAIKLISKYNVLHYFPQLINALKDSNNRVRYFALLGSVSLGNLVGKKDQITQILKQKLRDSCEEVRFIAIWYLRKYLPHDSISFLIDCLYDNSFRVRLEAVWILGELHDNRTLIHLVHLFLHPFSRAKPDLSELTKSEYLEEQLRLLNEGNYTSHFWREIRDFRIKILFALEKFQDPDLFEYIFHASLIFREDIRYLLFNRLYHQNRLLLTRYIINAIRNDKVSKSQAYMLLCRNNLFNFLPEAKKEDFPFIEKILLLQGPKNLPIIDFILDHTINSDLLSSLHKIYPGLLRSIRNSIGMKIYL